MHGFVNSQLMYNHNTFFISKLLNGILRTIEDLIPLEGPGSLLILLAELSCEDDLLVLNLFDLFVSEWDNPFLWLLKIQRQSVSF